MFKLLIELSHILSSMRSLRSRSSLFILKENTFITQKLIHTVTIQYSLVKHGRYCTTCGVFISYSNINCFKTRFYVYMQKKDLY